MQRKHLISALAALALVTSMLPAVTASHHAGPPDETGLGPGDVSNEQNTNKDDNGLDVCNPSCTAPNGTLVLDGDYSTGAYPYFVNYNTLIRKATADAGGVDTDGDGTHDEFIFPGMGWLSAWWGWWNDKGQGGYLHESGQSAPGVVGGQSDATINDGHDNHANNSDSIYTGDWDEFVWRGRNPWAGQTNWDNELGGKPSYDGEEQPSDEMFVFIDPGTHDTFGPTPGLLSNDSKKKATPDFQMDDRTDQTHASPGPVPHNNQAYGWVSAFGWHHFQYDQSLLMSTTITYSVNPEDTTGPEKVVYSGQNIGDWDGDGEKDHDGVDEDAYSAVHPQAETIYRTAVWDPGNEQASPTDAVYEEGARQMIRDAETEVIFAELDEQIEDARKPLNPAQGAADDQAFKPWPKEPDTGEEAGFEAPSNEDATYGNLNGQEGYYNEDTDADYTSYEDDFKPWLDARPEMAEPQFQVQLRSYASYNAFLAPTEGEERTAPPGFLFVEANAGGWNDANGDGWIGNLDETGRTTDPGIPYADGRVDNPHDYGDTPKQTEASAVKTDDPEWKGSGAKPGLTATLCPLGPDEYSGSCPTDAPWGTTEPPVGVYVLRDVDGQRFNPYDDMVEDTVGPVGPFADCSSSVGDFDCDDDGERLTFHVQRGPIEVVFNPDTNDQEGFYNLDENIVLPTGTATYDIRIETEATLGDIATGGYNGGNLQGLTVTDVDYLKSR